MQLHCLLTLIQQASCEDYPAIGPTTFKLYMPPGLEYVLECGSVEEKQYWMEIIRVHAGFKPTSELSE
jgi:hypothetical protein